MYGDFLGEDRTHVEKQMYDRRASMRAVDVFNRHISYPLRKNVSIGFYFVEEKVDLIIMTYAEKVSAEKIIEDMGYSFSECQPIGEGTYSIESATGMKRIMIYDTPEGTSAFLSG